VVDDARRRLSLGEAATTGEIKKAYHQLAEQLHPDHNAQDAQAEARMTELTQAYRLLMSLSANQSDVCSFSREAVEQTLVIDIRRQESFG
jgi:preprotein translocase subunit Sec63